MNRKFSNREKIMLVILALLLVVCCYYIFVDNPVRETLLDAETRLSAANAEIDIYTVKLIRLKKMQAALASLDDDAVADVPDFDNVKNVLIVLNDALSSSTDYDLTFRSVIYDGAIAERTIDMTFTCQNYKEARAILSVLTESGYRCRITSLSVTSSGSNYDMQGSSVSARATVVFYEFNPQPVE